VTLCAACAVELAGPSTAQRRTHYDWGADDRAMAEERRTAVLVSPQRLYANR
jgi:hypothetical protein